MITQYVIVEGPFDKFVLEHILPQELVSQSKILVGHSDNIALSKVRSLLISSELPVYQQHLCTGLCSIKRCCFNGKR